MRSGTIALTVVIRRLTLNYGVRFDYFNGYVPEQHVPAVRFVGARDFAAVQNHDVLPQGQVPSKPLSAIAATMTTRFIRRWGP